MQFLAEPDTVQADMSKPGKFLYCTIESLKLKVLFEQKIKKQQPKTVDGCLLVAYQPMNMLVYLKDGSAQAVMCAANGHTSCRPNLLSHLARVYILTPGLPVPALTLSRQAPGKVAIGAPIFESLV